MLAHRSPDARSAANAYACVPGANTCLFLPRIPTNLRLLTADEALPMRAGRRDTEVTIMRRGDDRFWTAFGSLLRQASSLEDESRAAMLDFLFSGPGSELLDTDLVGNVTIRDGLEIICGRANTIDTMKRLASLPAGLVADSDDPAELFARLILEKVAPQQSSSSKNRPTQHVPTSLRNSRIA